jgi:hypothetical protein
MRSSMEKSQGKKRLAVLVALMCAFVSIPALSSAASMGVSSAQPMMTIAVTNNSTRDIYHLYLSPVDRDAWGPDLVPEGTIIKPGQTFNITEATCAGNEIKVVAEDKPGCFVYGVVGCAETSTGWTITDAMPPDCGS